MQKPEAVAIESITWGEEFFVQLPSNSPQLPVAVRFVDQNYWKIFPFFFKQGIPFTEEDVESGIRTAVISETTARKIFGRIDVEGDYFSLNFNQYRVAGVVKDPSFAISRSYANVWVPYTLSPTVYDVWGPNQSMGANSVYLLAPSKGTVEDVKKEAGENVRKYATGFPEGDEFSLNGQPDRHWQSIFRFGSTGNPDFTVVVLIHLLILLILLIIPAVSLSGMIDSRMERRIAESGVRRAFGAPNRAILLQVLGENMLFTLLGGGVGLLFSYLIILIGRNRIMELGQMTVEVPVEGTSMAFTPGMLLNLPVFMMALLICILLNLLSATIPAWKASRKQIVYSLNSKQ
ncbi:MAG: ABC transporter permease [Tannerellaceae bacterium]|nr:ABC transporter permease [Tannerellaceae bacterium]